ncbi:MAG: hypothetical protein GX100_08590, partial [candidate division WS1 bacterium]|nr:hypothetical protein [candidate division WS1 bacterium]
QLRLTSRQAQFYLFKNGKAEPLGQSGTPPALAGQGQTNDLVIRQDGWRLTLLLNDRLICTAYDPHLTSGNLGYTLSGGKLSRVVLQPFAELYFSDDFMRAEGEGTLWKSVAGRWKETSLRIDPQASTMKEEMSANAFSYEGQATKTGERALSVAGNWFWADYRMEAAVRPLGEGACGLVICFRDPDNYLALRWTPVASEAPDANRLQLLERVDGQERVLSEAPGGYRAEQWYRLALGISDGRVSAWLDDEFLLTGRTSAFLQGLAGLLVEGVAGLKPEETGANFDDVVLETWGYGVDDFSTPHRWDSLNGTWQRADHRLVCSEGSGLALWQPCSWEHFTYTADCHLEQGAGGVVFGYTGPQDYYLLRYLLTDTPRAELVRVAGGQEATLTSAPFEKPSGHALRVGVVVYRNLVAGVVGGRTVLHAALEGAPTGRLGLAVQEAPGAWFSYATAQRINPPPASHVTKEFRDDEEHWEMAKWATTRSPWELPSELLVEKTHGQMVLKSVSGPGEFGPSVWWSKGDFYGDNSIVFPLASVGKVSGTLKVVIYATPDEKRQPVGGYTLALTSKASSTDLGVELLQGSTRLGQTQVKISEGKCQVELARSGPYLQVWIDAEMVLQVQVSQP